MKDRKVNRFKVDENGLTVDGYRVLDRSCLKSMYLSRMITVVVIAVIFFAVYKAEASAPELYRYIAVLVLVVVIVYALFSPIVFYKRYRYRMDDEKVEVRKGILYISHVLVPIERVHQVDVNAGPVNRLFGLADVSITTAGGVVTIQFLEEDVAESIATKLNDIVVRMLKERV